MRLKKLLLWTSFRSLVRLRLIDKLSTDLANTSLFLMALGLVRWLIFACLAASEVFHLASAAGRAFPTDSENYIIEEFQRINPSLDWDKTNFLVDLSGRYSDCSRLFYRGPISVDRDTPEGESIAGYVDYTEGSGSDVNSVKEYLSTIIERWISTRALHHYIHRATRFGCSVRPGCSGYVVTTCLFSPGEYSTRTSSSPKNPPPTPLTSTTEETTTERTTPKTNIRPSPPSPALALTREQYTMAEEIADMTWDRSHFLENLSGRETNCSMIKRCPGGWTFWKAEEYVSERGMRPIRGGCGSAPNEGSTPAALAKILRAVKHFPHASSIGCSVIPDCRDPYPNGPMYVVVSCLYQEP